MDESNIKNTIKSTSIFKQRKFYVAVAILVIVVAIVCFFVYQKYQKITDDTIVSTTPGLFDGNFVLDTKSPSKSSDVKISNSSENEISYEIFTVNLAHIGNVDGTAQRIASTTAFVYKDVLKPLEHSPYEGDCVVLISFIDKDHLFYDLDGHACNSFLGAHGWFFNNDIHEKNGSVTLPTIEKLGYTKEEIQIFNDLLSAGKDESTALDSAQEQIDIGATLVKKITSKDIPNATGYSIETPNIYDSVSPCFPDFGGYCTFVAFMKDAENNYWIIGGSNSGDFYYATNNQGWKNKLPSAFESELNRIGIHNDQIKFLP